MSVEQKKSIGMIIWLILSWVTTPAILKVIQQNNMVQVEKQFFTDVAPLNSHQFSRRVNHKKETMNLFEMWGRGRWYQFADQIYAGEEHNPDVTKTDIETDLLATTERLSLTVAAPAVEHWLVRGAHFQGALGQTPLGLQKQHLKQGRKGRDSICYIAGTVWRQWNCTKYASNSLGLHMLQEFSPDDCMKPMLASCKMKSSSWYLLSYNGDFQLWVILPPWKISGDVKRDFSMFVEGCVPLASTE